MHAFQQILQAHVLQESTLIDQLQLGLLLRCDILNTHIHLWIGQVNMVGVQRLFNVFQQIVIGVPVLDVGHPYAHVKIQR